MRCRRRKSRCTPLRGVHRLCIALPISGTTIRNISHTLPFLRLRMADQKEAHTALKIRKSKADIAHLAQDSAPGPARRPAPPAAALLQQHHRQQRQQKQLPASPYPSRRWVPRKETKRLYALNSSRLFASLKPKGQTCAVTTPWSLVFRKSKDGMKQARSSVSLLRDPLPAPSSIRYLDSAAASPRRAPAGAHTRRPNAPIFHPSRIPTTDRDKTTWMKVCLPSAAPAACSSWSWTQAEGGRVMVLLVGGVGCGCLRLLLLRCVRGCCGCGGG
jgi:hypothetical protein